MKPLIVLLVVFVLSLTGAKISGNEWNFIFAGNAAMSAMLLFTSIGHFMYPGGMALMVPPFIPFRTAVIYLTGFIEVAAAIGLLILSIRDTTALLLILFFILILPANIHAAIHKVNFEKGTNEGKGLNYLWFRIPLQLFFILWIWYFGLYKIPA